MGRWNGFAEDEMTAIQAGLSSLHMQLSHGKPKAALHPMLLEIWHEKHDAKLANVDRLMSELMSELDVVKCAESE